MKRKIWVIILLSTMAIGLFGGCSNKDEETNTQTQESEVLTEQISQIVTETQDSKEEFVQKEIELAASQKNDLCSFINVMAWVGDFVLPEEAADFCLSFVLNSLRESGSDYEKIINNYEGTYEEEYYLCMSEEALKKYLKDSIGYDDISVIKTQGAQNGEWDYYHFDGTTYKLMAGDTGDYGVGDAKITESYAISENEILIFGTVKSYILDDVSTNMFQMVFTENVDSIWGGYTLTEIKEWKTYILPDSDSIYLKQEELENLSKDYLRLARNEIYARHGYIFNDDELKMYFERQSWYKGTVTDVSDSELNEFEKANIELISMLESDAHLYKYQIVDSKSSFGWDYGNVVVISSYIGDNQSYLDVPETIEGYPVMVIGRSAFSNHKELVRINLPDSVKLLQECPFENCTNLQVIEMTGVTHVDVFPPTLRGLTSLETIYVGQSCFYDSFNDDVVEFIDILPRKTYHAATGKWTSEVEVKRG